MTLAAWWWILYVVALVAYVAYNARGGRWNVWHVVAFVLAFIVGLAVFGSPIR